MDPNAREDLLLRLFQRLRANGVPLGIAELLDARRVLASAIGADTEAGLRRVLRLLWCSSAAQNAELDVILHRLIVELERAGPDGREPLPPPEPRPPPRPPQEEPPARDTVSPPASIARPPPEIMPLPVRAPEAPEAVGSDEELISDQPVSGRAMAYTWRYLRRPVKDGPCDVLDLHATVERTARQGYFDRPVLARRLTDHGHLVLLVDQGGSMVPFHRLTRDLVQTAAESSLGRVDIAYFQNVPAEHVYTDPHRTKPIGLEDLLAECRPESSVLIVSDAGAARGGRDRQRFMATARVLVRLKQQSGAIAWLNPVPEQRWPGSTAQLIAAIVAMYPMDEDGFGKAIDVLRGQPLGGRR